MGAILSQGEPGNDLPVAYASRIMNKHEKNYSVTEKELLAITWSVKYFRPYLFGKKFTIYCDHKPLIYLMNVRDPSSRLLKFRLKLDEYDYQIIHKPGKINTNADALSRAFPISSSPFVKKKKNRYRHTLDSTTSVSDIGSDDEFIENSCFGSQRDSSVVQNSLNFSAAGPSAPNRSNTESTDALLPVEFSESTFQNVTEPTYTEFFRDVKGTTFSDKIHPLKEEIPVILGECHDSPTGGHQGILRTFKRVKARYAWPGMLGDVAKYVKKCPNCQIMKPNPLQNVPLQITKTSSFIFEKVIIDIVGPLPITPRNNKYLLTIQDDLSKFLVAIPIPNQESVTISNAFATHFICIFGVPKIILTDQGSNLTGRVFKHLCKIFGIKKINSTAYRPQTQGSLERAHRTVKEYLRGYVNKKQTNWDQLISYVCSCFNTSVSTSTDFTPYELVFGQTCR